jgi:hypothetical protein
MSRIRLIAASDDYLLEEQLTAAVAEVCAALGEVDPEVLPEETTPEGVATELVSPSLFAAERVLVIADTRVWLGAPVPAGASAEKEPTPDLKPLLQVLGDGVPEGMGLVMGAWCGRKPSGELVEAVEAVGTFRWIPLPPPPKPWEDAVLSREQFEVLEGLVHRTAGGVGFSRPAVQLLLERLGFAPRLLVQEVRKLIGAAGTAEVDEDLVRRLTFPRERSLEVVRDAIFNRQLEPLLDLVAAASSGAPINDWRGQRIEPSRFGPSLFGMVTSLQHQMLYLRRVCAAAGLEGEMSPETTGRKGWYARRFKNELAPKLLERIREDAPSPLARPGSRPPTPFSLAAIFAGAGRYSEGELLAAISDGAAVEAALRQSEGEFETMSSWLAAVIVNGTR